MAKTRKTISINEEIWEMICKNADIYGMSASNYISMCCVQVAQQSVAISNMPKLQEAFEKMDNLTLKQLEELMKQI